MSLEHKTFDLDTTLIAFGSPAGQIRWSWRDAVQGLAVFGGIGSGKTSGSARCISLSMLKAGAGGLVLTAKETEKDLWVEYARLTNRTRDLIILEPGGTHRFNFVQYESTHGAGQKSADNLIDLLTVVMNAGIEQNQGHGDDPFWRDSLKLLMTNTIDLCQLAYGEVSIPMLYDIIQTIPKSTEQSEPEYERAFHDAFAAAAANARKASDRWLETLSEEDREVMQFKDLFDRESARAVPEVRTLKCFDQFFHGYIKLADKTRGIIDMYVASFLFPLLREPVYSLFCAGPSTFTPEDCLNGKIVIVNLPVKEYDQVGRTCQLMVKYCYQRAMERRRLADNPYPVFLYADEAQEFIHPKDSSFQATARSCRVVTVYVSQNLPNFYASMSGAKSEHRLKAFLGTLATKVFHANADVDSNRYASELIGDAFFEDRSESVTISKEFSQTRGRSVKLERAVRPEEFGALASGGPHNRHIVTAYMHKQGDPFPNGRNHALLAFDQNFIP